MPLIQSPGSGAAAAVTTHALPGTHYGFSGVRIDDLGATEYTLVVLAADTSGSVGPFSQHIEDAAGEVVRACARSPRADHLLLRVTRFDDTLEEVHGFRALHELDPAAYRGRLKPGGCTALHDAALNAVGSVTHYGDQLVRHAFGVNAIVFIITDGQDNRSRATAAEVAAAVAEARRNERLESLVTVLVGVNLADDATKKALDRFAREAGFSEFLALDQADAATLARVAAFVSRCVSAQSTCLGTGRAAALPVLGF